MPMFKMLYKDHPLAAEGEVVTDAQIRLWSTVADIRWLCESGILKPIGNAIAELATEAPTVEQLLAHSVDLGNELQSHAEKLHDAEIVIGKMRAENEALKERNAVLEDEKRELLGTHAAAVAEKNEAVEAVLQLRAKIEEKPVLVPEQPRAPMEPAPAPAPPLSIDPPAKAPPPSPGPPKPKK